MESTGERFIPGRSGQTELEHLNRYYFVINQIDLINKVVLDLASGEGYGSDLLARYSKQVFGVDISVEAIDHAKSKYIKNNLAFLVGDAANIPLSSHSIDIFVCFETIEHHDKHEEMFVEIKRVLKQDGTLVMSSPDKYFYSDLPKYKNKFHVKELYYNEFKKLITTNFKNAIFYSQKVFVGSIITLDEGKYEYRKPLVVENDFSTFDFNPVYNLAIATDDPSLSPVYQQILYKESDTIFTKRDVDQAIQMVRNSKAYKIGDLFIAPLRLIKRFFSKI